MTNDQIIRKYIADFYAMPIADAYRIAERDVPAFVRYIRLDFIDFEHVLLMRQVARRDKAETA